MSSILIELGKTDFAGGERVEGQVVLQLDREIPIRGIRISNKGHAEASWTTGSGKNRRRHIACPAAV